MSSKDADVDSNGTGASEVDENLLLHLTQHGLIKPRPPRDAWQRLSAYESAELVRKLLYKRHRREPNVSKATEVAVHVSQGRQFFQAAASSDVLARPLLLYYGVLALSRATILCSDVNLREATLEGGHGLNCGEGWNNQPTNGRVNIPDLQVKATRGTFSSLAQATQNTERYFIFADFQLRVSEIQRGTQDYRLDEGPIQFKVSEVLARLPDLADLYALTFGRLGASHPAFVNDYPNLQRDYYFLSTESGRPTEETIRRQFGIHPDVQVREHESHYWLGEVRGIELNINKNVSPPTMRDKILPTKNDSLEFPYIVEPFPGGIQLSTFSLLFMLSFIMGMLVRYHPSQWAILTHHGTGDALRPMLSAASELIERRIPELVLDELEQSGPIMPIRP